MLVTLIIALVEVAVNLYQSPKTVDAPVQDTVVGAVLVAVNMSLLIQAVVLRGIALAHPIPV
jgi:hypothetical protein